MGLAKIVTFPAQPAQTPHHRDASHASQGDTNLTDIVLCALQANFN